MIRRMKLWIIEIILHHHYKVCMNQSTRFHHHETQYRYWRNIWDQTLDS